MESFNKYIELSEEVKKAFLNKIKVVALESTIISHGMPYPENLRVAKMCEEKIRENGCVPATIALIKGKIKIGLNEDELTYLAKKGRKINKVSRRDIAYTIALAKDGATTVSATMYLASLKGIKIFATGGIGGVHRGAEATFDISCDLEELSKTNVSVVCAGAKAILDLPKTLEYLETLGVLVIGYKTNILPAFYTSKSNSKVDLRCDSAKEIASIIDVKEDLHLPGGILITNPIKEEDELDSTIMENAINEAIKDANSKNISGKEITPFLLEKITSLTKGDSLKSNIKLVLNNCDLASKIAKCMRD